MVNLSLTLFKKLFKMNVIIYQFSILLILLSSVYNNQCDLPECHEEAKRLVESINDRIDVCEDFTEFACSKQFELFDRLNTFNEMSLVEPTTYRFRIWEIRKKLKDILGRRIESKDENGVRMAKIYWQACRRVNPENLLTDVRFLFKRLGGWSAINDVWNNSLFSWDKFSKCSRSLGFLPSMFIHIGVNVDDVHKSSGPNDTIKLTIERPFHINQVIDNIPGYLGILGILTKSRKPSADDIKSAIEFGKQFHEIKCENERDNYMKKMTIAKLQELHPIINWMEYLTEILTYERGNNLSFLDYIHVDVCFLSQFPDIIQRTDNRIQANYAFLTIIDDLFRLIRPELALYFTSGRPEIEQICLDSTATIFSKAIDMIIARSTNAKMREKVIEIENNLIDKILNGITHISWMDNETQINITKKIKKLSFINLFPDDIFNDEYFNRLELLQKDAIEMHFHRTNTFLVDHYYLQAGNLRNKFIISEQFNQSINFIDMFSSSDLFVKPDLIGNRVYIPAASVLTRKLHFSLELDYLNYATVGREIATALGSYIYQKNSPIQKSSIQMDDTWWSKSTIEQFMRREQCRIITTREICSDFNSSQFIFALIGGIEIAYKSVFELCDLNCCATPLPALNYTARQLFWINVVASDCDRHLKYRYNTVLSNINEFSRDFNCSNSSKMNRSNKCTLF